MKLKWKVSNIPTGRFSSFERRAWPMADFENGKTAAMISCNDEYVPSNVKTGNHSPLTIRVACWRAQESGIGQTFDWKTLKTHAATLKDAKLLAQLFFDTNKQYLPKHENQVVK